VNKRQLNTAGPAELVRVETVPFTLFAKMGNFREKESTKPAKLIFFLKGIWQRANTIYTLWAATPYNPSRSHLARHASVSSMTAFSQACLKASRKGIPFRV
jgi:hypothetical protein